MIETTRIRRDFIQRSCVALILAVLVAAAPAFGHGGKGHGRSEFTALLALQKATKLYDRLVGSGKLPPSWETDLARVEISIREQSGGKEYAVSFQRVKGDPETVYIFFNADGTYVGSNFTGK